MFFIIFVFVLRAIHSWHSFCLIFFFSLLVFAVYLKCSIFCRSLDGFFRLICYLMCLTSVLTLGRTIAVDQGQALKPKVETVKVGKLVERRTIYKVSFSNQQWTYKCATMNKVQYFKIGTKDNPWCQVWLSIWQDRLSKSRKC